MNRRAFMRLIGCAAAAPLALVPGPAALETLDVVVEGAGCAGPVSNLDGLLKNLYMPSLMQLTLEKAPILEYLSP